MPPRASKSLRIDEPSEVEDGGRLRVLTYSMPQMGHITPVLEFATALSARGHSVTFATAECWRARLEGPCDARGCTFIGLRNELEDAYCRRFGPDNPGFEECGTKDKPLLETLIAELDPHVLVCDFMSVAMVYVAESSGIPLVMNIPGPYGMLPKMKTLSNPVLNWLIRTFGPLPAPVVKLVGEVVTPALQRTVVTVNSAWGLDSPQPVPPNVVLTGPLIPRGEATKQLNVEEHPQLMAFVERARAASKPLVYVTTGSVLELNERQVKALFEGLNGCDCWVLWSLKENTRKFLPETLPEKLFCSGWMPQIEIIALDDVKVVLSHCGWGGTLECMQFGKPVLCFPGFGDQFENADLLVKQGCAIKINPKKFAANDVKDSMTRLLKDNDTFAGKAMNIQRALLASPGAPIAVDLVESAAKHGIDHLISGTPLHKSEYGTRDEYVKHLMD